MIILQSVLDDSLKPTLSCRLEEIYHATHDKTYQYYAPFRGGVPIPSKLLLGFTAE